MEFKIFHTSDGSESIIQYPLGVSYHSHFGAKTESNLIYIEYGLKYFIDTHPNQSCYKVFEMGFGSGLNALLTAEYSRLHQINIEYHTCELYPLPIEFTHLMYRNYSAEFDLLHVSPWNTKTSINPWFTLYKYQEDIRQLELPQNIDIIFYDAFDPQVQPELWTYAIFKNLYEVSNDQAVLTTYSSKSQIRKNMESAGWSVTKIKGPKGKREVVRGIRSLGLEVRE